MESVHWTLEQLSDGILRVAFFGKGGLGSEGHREGDQMCEVLHRAIHEYGPTAIIIDLCDFDYQFGDWIGSVLLRARSKLGRGCVCVVATGRTAASLHSLWEFAHLDRAIPLVNSVDEAMQYLKTSKPDSQD